jgi:PAS domain S-box-containing protein
MLMMLPSPIHVLMVDDEPDILDISKEFLEQIRNISVNTASSAAHALDMIKIQEYDIIISDYQMPGKDGIQLLKEIRETGNKVPFIIFTGKGREEVVIKAFENGADFYVQKGGEIKAQFAELEHKIKSAVDRRRANMEVGVLNRLYAVLSATNKAIVRIHDIKELLREICRIDIDIGGFSMVWAGLLNPEKHMIEPIAMNGHIDGFLDSIAISIEDTPQGRGPNGIVFRKRTFKVCNDIANDPTVEPWREEALRRGFHSMAAFPFALDTKNAGVINYFASETEFFTDSVIRLLIEQNNDLTWAFASLENEEQRISAENDLKRSELQYRRLFETAQDAILILDGDTGKIVEANSFILDLLGYPLEYCIGKYLWELGFIRDKDIAQQAFTELKTKGYIRYENIPMKTKDGRSISIDLISNSFLVGDKKIFQCNIRDITARNRVEDLLRESEEKFWTYLDNSPEGIFIVDAAGDYQDVNRTACTMLNYSYEELLDLNIRDISDKSTLQESLRKFQELQEKGSMNQETIFVGKGGIRVPVFLNAVELPNKTFMAFCTDITERKRMEDALYETDRKLKLLSSITRHDINNQLTVLNGYLMLCKTREKDPALITYMDKMCLATANLQKQIEFTKDYQDIGMQEPTWAAISRQIDNAFNMLHPKEVELENSTEGVEVLADPLAEKVPYNLIENSIRHGGHVTRIKMSAEQVGDALMIVYEDDGVGISTEGREHLFEKGYGKNTGLGLFFIRDMLAITGITITENGKVGQGVRFEMMVPSGSWRRSSH